MSDNRMPSNERLNAIGAHAFRGALWRHRAGNVPIVTMGEDGRVSPRDPWDVLLPAVPQLSEATGPLPAENEAQRHQARQAMAELIGLAGCIVRESGDPSTFDAAQWTGEFLATPHPALGGRRPADLFHTPEGQRQVIGLVAQMQSGAYS